LIELVFADKNDDGFLAEHDSHIGNEIRKKKIEAKEIIVLKKNGQTIGWLRYGLFWDMIPFMNMLYIKEHHRRKGLGKQLVLFWENEMWECGHKVLMTSSQSDEEAQHFYRKLGYEDAGSLMFPKGPLEIIFIKYRLEDSKQQYGNRFSGCIAAERENNRIL